METICRTARDFEKHSYMYLKVGFFDAVDIAMWQLNMLPKKMCAFLSTSDTDQDTRNPRKVIS